MQATMEVNNSIKAYMIRLDVEFLQVGHAEQHKLQAALPQQQAKEPALQIPKIAPMTSNSERS